MPRSRTRIQPCSLCGVESRTGFYYHEGTGHGVDGWESDQPLCLSCARLMIWGEFLPPFSQHRRRHKEAL